MFSTKAKSGTSIRAAARQQILDGMVRSTHNEALYVSAVNHSFQDKNEDVPDENQAWDEIIFQNRNKEYGAYKVRQGYNSNVTTGMIVTIIVVVLVILYPKISEWLSGNEAHQIAAPRKLIYAELSAPPPIDKPKPPPPSVQLPRLQKVIKFVPPKVVKEHVTELVPLIQDIKQAETGNEEITGPTNVVFDEPIAEIIEKDDELFTVVDQQPEFEGGYQAMMAFIRQNMTYPPNARRMQIEGTVHVSFIVSKTGDISDVIVLRGIMGECDREAVRVVQAMPRWKPGKQNGRSVNVRFILPLKFKLS